MSRAIELFDLEEDRVKAEIARLGARRVFVQLPEGLKPAAPRIASVIEEAGALAIISADPCYGACDLAVHEAEILSADLIIHYGHSGMPGLEIGVPILYVEARANVSVRDAVEDALKHLEPWDNIGLAATVQHVHALNEAREILEGAGKRVYVGHVAGLKYHGQVLGCDYRNAKAVSDLVEAFLLIGGGLFHALGLFLATMKPTIVADPFEGKARRVDDEANRVINRRWMDISEAMGARRWGVITGLKTGQTNLESSLRIKGDLEAAEKEVVLLAMREVTPEALMEFPSIEAYVNTACPRISLYESRKFPRPLLTPREVYVALGKMRWEDYLRLGML
ncbi:MAG: diphthamide biosynthesis enzyme Dph2 [Candidatus Bathyarchaeia archaeon]